MSDDIRDVIVVGAGFTGLAAALDLVKAGLEVIVLEARDRVGGRVESETNAFGERVDTGGQFLCEDMPNVMALAQAGGGRLLETWMTGNFVTQPDMGSAEAEAVYREAIALRERMAGIGPEEAGSRTVAEWLVQQPARAEARSAFQSMIEGLWCQPIETVPLAYLADNDRRVTNRVSELQYFPENTMHSLAEGMAAELGDAVVTGTPAGRVIRRADGVSVEAGGRTFEARAAIVAVPPVAASRIDYSPALPAELADALSVWRSGTVIKATLRYATPFWRGRGLSGMVMWRDIHGLFACDASRDADHAALVVFIGGPLALEWRGLGPDRLRAAIVERLAVALGEEARDAIAWTVRDWCGDRWSGGGYSDIAVEAGSDAEDRLRAGWPPLFFASSELSPSFPGYVEGALVAGRAVARNVAAQLAGQLPIATRASGS